MKRFFVLPLLIALTACGSSDSASTPQTAETPTSATTQTATTTSDAEKGLGKFKDVELGPLDNARVAKGNKISDMKCASCHRMDDKKLVGPGWKGVTERRTPEWILNFITNVDENLDKDPQSMAMLEEYLVRMPNQNLTDDDAMNILEYMRHNDQKQ